MVIGIPNVGKSSLINALRRQHLRKGTAGRCELMLWCLLASGRSSSGSEKNLVLSQSLMAPQGCLFAPDN